jgi:type III secretion protein W
MMADDSLSHMSKTNLTRLDTFTNSLQETQEAGKMIEEMLKANQMEASKDKLQNEAEDNSALGIQIRTRKLEARKEIKTEKAKEAKESVLIRKEEADGLADGFSQRHGNREYRIDPRLLSQLAEDVGIGINENLHPDELISFVRRRLTVNGESPDVAIVDKALEFLLEALRVQLATAKDNAKERLENIYKKIEVAKGKYFESHAVEIQVAQKIIGAVDAVVETTGQTIKETLDRYRFLVHNPLDIHAFRKLYESKGYRELRKELDGLSSYLGGNFKRANMEGPEIAQLARSARQMQAVLGVFRQAKVQIPTMKAYLRLHDTLLDSQTFNSYLNFEVVAKLFFDTTEERYPSAEKMRQLVGRVATPIENQEPVSGVNILIAVSNAMRDMIKEVAPTQLYRTPQHRDDLYMAIIESLEDLEDELEELEEKHMRDEDEEEAAGM